MRGISQCRGREVMRTGYWPALYGGVTEGAGRGGRMSRGRMNEGGGGVLVWKMWFGKKENERNETKVEKKPESKVVKRMIEGCKGRVEFKYI
ncbi:hypothetical protein E2C01_102513 [Portunus trituberculatus]|uniref:Uncharacterized protein n=1 Tax=Portunus trituberculatus TaxID=210409 RepID=A0A5B7KN03_PORTR|nr:hypothetical protein [Portunus trituberculatus]